MSTSTVVPFHRHPTALHQQFVRTYSPFVLRDFETARSHASDGHYLLTVTPKRFVVRTQRPSSLRINLNETGVSTRRLKSLYEELKPDWVKEVVFGKDTVAGHVWMLTVDIRFDQSKLEQATLPARTKTHYVVVIFGSSVIFQLLLPSRDEQDGRLVCNLLVAPQQLLPSHRLLLRQIELLHEDRG